MRDNYTFRCTQTSPLTFIVDIHTGWINQPFQDHGEYTFKSFNPPTKSGGCNPPTGEVSVYVRVGMLNGIDLNRLHADLCKSMFSEDMSETSRKLFETKEEKTTEQEPYRYSRKTQTIVDFWEERGLKVNRVIQGVTCYTFGTSCPFIIFTKSDANTSKVSKESVPQLFRVQLGTDGMLYSNFTDTQQIWRESETWKNDLQGLANKHGSFHFFGEDAKQTTFIQESEAASSPPRTT